MKQSINKNEVESIESIPSQTNYRGAIRLFREPIDSINVSVVSNDILDSNFEHSDTAKVLLLMVLREDNNFEFTIPWAAAKLHHAKTSIRNAINVLESLGHLRRVHISAKEVEYYFYESPYLNPEFQNPVKKKKRSNPNRSNKRPVNVKSQVKMAIRKIEQAQSILLNVSLNVPLQKNIDMLQLQRRRLLESIGIEDDDDLYDDSEYDEIERESDFML